MLLYIISYIIRPSSGKSSQPHIRSSGAEKRKMLSPFNRPAVRRTAGKSQNALTTKQAKALDGKSR